MKFSRGGIADLLLSAGKTHATTSELSKSLGVPTNQVRMRLRKEILSKHFVTPARGLWIPVPPQYRNMGSPPSLELIDYLMKYLDREYYVGWLSAANYYGASHHSTQVLQVAVNKQLNEMRFGRNRIKYYFKNSMSELPLLTITKNSYRYKISSIELTVMDLVSKPTRAAGINNLANVIYELFDNNEIDTKKIISLQNLYPGAAYRRLGYILENTQSRFSVTQLKNFVEHLPLRDPSLLSPYKEAIGELDSSWNLIINHDLDIDL